MNCSVCGSPLLFDRVVFRCECGVYVHAYCADKHIVTSHRPELEEGYADLNGDFHLKHRPEAVPVAALAEGLASDAEGEGGVFEEELVAGVDVAKVTESEVEAEAEAEDEAGAGEDDR